MVSSGDRADAVGAAQQLALGEAAEAVGRQRHHGRLAQHEAYIRVVGIGKDYRNMTVRVARSLLTRNMNGTTFGGTIFSAADPFYATMYWQFFARENIRIRIWLRSASIRYLQPAASALTLEFSLSEERIVEAMKAIRNGDRFISSHTTEAVDSGGVVCASIETEFHIRPVAERS